MNKLLLSVGKPGLFYIFSMVLYYMFYIFKIVLRGSEVVAFNKNLDSECQAQRLQVIFLMY